MMNTPELYRLLGRVLGDRDHLLMLGMQEAADGAIFSAQKPQGNKGACLVRGFIFGDDQWRTGWVIGSRQVKLANHLITTSYTVEYAVAGKRRTADFFPYFGEIWWVGHPEPRISAQNTWFHNLTYHRIVFVPVLTLYKPHNAAGGSVVPIWFPALLDSGITKPGQSYMVRIFGVCGSVQKLVSSPVVVDSTHAASIIHPHVNALQTAPGSELKSPYLPGLGPDIEARLESAWNRTLPLCEMIAEKRDCLWKCAATFKGPAMEWPGEMERA